MMTILLLLCLLAGAGIYLVASGKWPARTRSARGHRRRITESRIAHGGMLAALIRDPSGVLSVERLTDQKSNTVPMEEYFAMPANTVIVKGQMVGLNAAGQIQPVTSAGTITVLGAAMVSVSNATPQTGLYTNSDGLTGLAGQGSVPVQYGVNLWNNAAGAGAISAANIGQPCWQSDDQTVSLLEVAGLPAGIICGVGDEKGGGDGQVHVWQGPAAIAAALALIATQGDVATGVPFRARNVVTSLAAYTGSGTATLTASANGAWATNDGVTNAVNDVVFIQAGTTNLTGALDSGPWQISNLGGASAKWVLIRPSWWQNTAVMPLAAIIEIDGEGTAYAGTSWKSFAAVGSAVIGTNDPAFYVRFFVASVTLVTGFATLTGQTFPGLRSTTKSGIEFQPTNFNGGGSTVSYRTGAYASGGAATVAGYCGTSSVSITALVAAGTFNTSDVGTGLVMIENW